MPEPRRSRSSRRYPTERLHLSGVGREVGIERVLLGHRVVEVVYDCR
jgi:hypothetical protein